MAPRRNRQRRRGNRNQGVGAGARVTTSNTGSVLASSEVQLKSGELEILKDRNYRPLRISVTFLAKSNPAVVQIQLYNNQGLPCFNSPLALVGSATPKTVTVSWPPTTEWFSENKDVVVATIRNSCPATTQTGSLVTFVSRVWLLYGPDIDTRQCHQAWFTSFPLASSSVGPCDPRTTNRFDSGRSTFERS